MAGVFYWIYPVSIPLYVRGSRKTPINKLMVDCSPK